MGQRHYLAAERRLGDLHEFLESEVGLIGKHRTGWSRTRFHFEVAAIEAHLPIEGRSGIGLERRCLALEQYWSEGSMAMNGKWQHAEVVDWGNDDEEEMPPSQQGHVPLWGTFDV